MVLLLVTGTLAKDIVVEQSKLCKIPTKVLVLDLPVASLMKPLYILYNIKDKITPDIDCIMVPGLVQGDIRIIEEKTGIRTVRGPKSAYDISFIVNNFGLENLSKDIPACTLFKKRMKDELIQSLEKIENDPVLQFQEGNYSLKGLSYGISFPTRIIAEIVDAPLLTNDHIKEIVNYYVQSGADVIDIGMLATEDSSKELPRIINSIKSVTDKPISIDSMNENEINEAIKLGIDMVISLDRSLLRKVAISENVHYVLIPIDLERKYFPKDPEERIYLLIQIYEEAKNLGFRNLILDPILDSPFSQSLVKSIVSYFLLRNKLKNVPILMGTGNITEMIDADSTGMNALLAAIASELNASFILTTEVSNKCKSTVKELSIASKMMFAAKLKKSYPKDLGVDLLIYKDKKLQDEPIEDDKNAKVYYCNEPLSYMNDPKGWFKVYVDRIRKEVVVHHKPKYNSLESDVVIRGTSVEGIYRTIASLGLVSRLDHASYIAAEVQKAYIALKMNRTYIQDSDILNRDYD
jgi:dihydropteroate synthase-like protein